MVALNTTSKIIPGSGNEGVLALEILDDLIARSLGVAMVSGYYSKRPEEMKKRFSIQKYYCESGTYLLRRRRFSALGSFELSLEVVFVLLRFLQLLQI